MTLVLIVDDSPMDRLLAAGLLEKQAGFRIVTASNGQEGFDAVRELRPDLILTDMQMPVMNGMQMVVKLREEGIQTPVILMTAKGSEDLAVEALAAGASSYVSKRSLSKRLVETTQMILSAGNDVREQSILMNRITSHCASFELENRVEECLALSRYLQTTLSRIWNLNLASRLRIGLALEEALTNALYHGNLEVSSSLKERSDNCFYNEVALRQTKLPYSSRRISVTAKMTSEETRFVISDCGPGFDVTQLPDPTDPENLVRPSGRGVMLMHAFMDEVVYNDRGNQVTLVKRRESLPSMT
jgi:CheY-like chemotaxis protein/anti-sigma regulatory factor (Ser/Thr protein kinase)